MRATLVALSAILLTGSAGVSAAPAPSVTVAREAVTAPMQLAQRDHRDGRWQHEQRRHDMRGHHGRRHGPPAGWQRYRYRPHDYHRRGCTQIGPAWFCP
ncbi:hypothetical protein [Bradyrhizobium sp. HKCCYLS20291]|uniref:hypothetical protein n=1 Tax=Bradyrhizobium sp. HKCCYLS20291 TaxID=3420766 RepID=UPI003EBD4A65